MKRFIFGFLLPIIIMAAGSYGMYLAEGAVEEGYSFESTEYEACEGATLEVFSSVPETVEAKYLSSDPSVAYINENGELVTVSPGTVTISVSYEVFTYSTEVTVEAHVGEPATCTTAFICETCGETVEEALGHDFTEVTCTEDSVCTRCGLVNEKALGHQMVWATCETDEYCKRCGEVFAPAYGHSWREARCTEPAICRRCFKSGEPALGHDFSEPTCTEDSACTRCGEPGELLALGHDITEATCTEPETCLRCGETFGEALGHDPSQQVCLQPVVCLRCGVTITEALEHNWKAATCTKPKTCKRCKETEGEALGHAFTEATCTKAATCERCGITSGSSLGHNYVETSRTTSGNTTTVYYTCSRCGITTSESTTSVTEAQAYNAMIALKSQYPEGMTWTNDNFYAWNGGIYYGGYGCAGFAFILSDAAFGNLPARMHYDYTAIKVGDILRLYNDSHSVIVLERNSSGIVIAEGNYNSSIHWGRTLTWSEVQSNLTNVMTRYPQ